jgi:hypothetical protein
MSHKQEPVCDDCGHPARDHLLDEVPGNFGGHCLQSGHAFALEGPKGCPCKAWVRPVSRRELIAALEYVIKVDNNEMYAEGGLKGLLEKLK